MSVLLAMGMRPGRSMLPADGGQAGHHLSLLAEPRQNTVNIGTDGENSRRGGSHGWIQRPRLPQPLDHPITG